MYNNRLLLAPKQKYKITEVGELNFIIFGICNLKTQ